MHFQGLLLVRAPQTNFDGIKILNKINKVENRTSNMAVKKGWGGGVGEVGEGALLTSQHSSFSFTCAFSAANPQSKAHALVQSKAQSQSQSQSQSQCAASSTSTATSAEMLKLILRLCCNKLIEFALSQASCIGIGRGRRRWRRNGKSKGKRGSGSGRQQLEPIQLT